MTETVNITIAIVVLIGSLLSFITAFGLLRLPDVYTRGHAASKSATLGVLFVLSGTLLYFWFAEGYFSARIVLGIIFVFITSPVAGHLITRAAYYSGVPLWKKSVQDDLKNKAKPETIQETKKQLTE